MGMRKLNRRNFIKFTGLGVLAAALPAPRPAAAGILSRLFGTQARETPQITPNEDFYLTSCCPIPQQTRLDPTRWHLTIRGLVRSPMTLRYQDLLERERVQEIVTLICIGNEVGGSSIGTAKWEGVRLKSLLDKAGVLPKAYDLALHAADGYTDSFPLERGMQEDVLLAYHMNGVPLPREHGYPLRVIVPGIYGMKNVKWITDIEVVEKDYLGYWEHRGWSDSAIIKSTSRIDAPGDGETLRGSDYRVKGIAFAGPVGISRVEVSTDDGELWREAKLNPILSQYAWRHWTFSWKIPRQGRYRIKVRAIDGQGTLQEETPRDSYPDGASGLHVIHVSVS